MNKCEIIVEEKRACYGQDELPTGLMFRFHDVTEAHRILIGKFQIAKLFIDKNNRVWISSIDNDKGFKSISAAVRGIKERMRCEKTA